ncbi:hypothetical protein AVEN_274818-1 [Araneus ventricosus]|uniref:Uncharacterized protein n=1 Tax=Araneus ventricosus TaxID=182803 RepID=A0A4Y2SMX7_ARAVE|nr:hypothetical protein AVEN_156857-1 [Araneus ventricosus]GBN90293.1 hypothetical protein AVEN_274818-1 [Araneus ventricosus]
MPSGAQKPTPPWPTQESVRSERVEGKETTQHEGATTQPQAGRARAEQPIAISVWPPNRHNKRQPRVLYHATTSGFNGKRKLQAVQLFNSSKYLQDIPEIFNNPKSTYTDIEKAGVHLRIVQQHEERGK